MADWTPEVVVAPAEARALVREHLPQLPDVEPRLLGAGFDNTAYALGDWIVRFPRRGLAAALLERETERLPLLAARLPVPIPQPLPLVRPRTGFPFAAYRRLPGDTACGGDSGDTDDTRATDLRLALAAPVGRFLAALHAVPVSPSIPGPDPVDRANLSVRGPRLRARLAELPRLAHLAPLAADLADTPPWTGPPVWVHGDLYPRHLLHDGRHLVGVIDWGDTHAGDPAVNLALLGMLPPPARAALLDAYVAGGGVIDAPLLRRARFHTLRYLAAFTGYAADTGDVGMARMAGSILDAEP